jgi:dCTP diphosphatase
MQSLIELRDRVRAFAAARDWEQFHSPKNLASALIVEAAELLEHFQWLTPAQSEQLSAAQREAVAHEIADVLLYLVNLADRMNVDLLDAAERKMALNEIKYPVASARGKADNEPT